MVRIGKFSVEVWLDLEGVGFGKAGGKLQSNGVGFPFE